MPACYRCLALRPEDVITLSADYIVYKYIAGRGSSVGIATRT
jgi:hypothetical protein